MNKSVEKILIYVIFSYLSIPILIFLLGWIKLYISIPLALLLITGIWSYLKDTYSEIRNEDTTLSMWKLISVSILAFVWVYLSGIGGYSNQDWDHNFRNAVFADMINYSWPIYYKFSPAIDLDFLAGNYAGLNYYLTFWLPAALIGKAYGTNAANAALLVWSFIGILLALFLLFRLLNYKMIVLSTIVFILWSGLDVLGKLIIQRHIVGLSEAIEMYFYYSYTSFTTDLFNVFNQVVPTWIITLWVLNYKKKIPILPIGMLFAYAPFPFIVLVLFYAINFCIDVYRQHKTSKLFSLIIDLFGKINSVSVVATVLAIGFPYLAFYHAHNSVLSTRFFPERLVGKPWGENIELIMNYFITFVVEAGLFFALIRWLTPTIYLKNKQTYWIAFWLLLLIPACESGVWQDFATRGSIPVLTVLLVLTLLAIRELYHQKHYFPKMAVMAVVLLLSWVTPFWLLIKAPALEGTPKIRTSVGSFGQPRVSETTNTEGVLSSLPNFYSTNPQHKFFYRLLAKRTVPVAE
ncbi:hypothetical protein [Fibrella aquatica]|uniref:hypothetical protein n=1 Tax=Fibrella aquatica TaxID=3242487 RepID=UPI00351F96A2